MYMRGGSLRFNKDVFSSMMLDSLNVENDIKCCHQNNLNKVIEIIIVDTNIKSS